MIRKLFFAFIILSSFIACTNKTAFNYSESFAKKEQELTGEITKTETQVTTYSAYQQFDSIRVAGERMEKLIEDKIKEIRNEPAPDVKEGENFKNAGIKYFEFMKSVYTGYKDYGAAQTPEERATILERIQKLASQKQAVSSEIQAAQQKFAKANGFKIEG